ncbi:SWIM zinc finger family protein [Halobaculum sp. D14]|uniref:SWIM zinc finger family protein n=1 Tax=Halobaculum sp. D14 TaxID=3421642 RepID=UPI003EB69D52
MATTSRTGEKRTAVEQLSFGSRTGKRVAWESWEFTVVGPHLVEVTNASYGYLKDEHSYVVGVEKRGGIALPAECECPADVHREPDCKHKVALATVGGPTVLKAAVATEVSKTGDALRAADDSCPNGTPDCEGVDGNGLPCFDCYSEGV